MEPFDPLVVHGAVESDPLHHAVNVPIYQTSTYELEDVAQFPEFAYSRVSNPTQKAVEAQIAAMEHGHAGFAFASGMTPYLHRPLDFGFDIVVQSATKYLGGHSDLLEGLLVTGSQALTDRVKVIKNFTGGILNPFDAWLLLRGIKTLGVRMERHQKNARFLAEYLREHDGVEKIYYPGFSDFPGYAVHKAQAAGPGAMISFVLSERYDQDVFMKSLRIIKLAISLGGVESLLGHPVTMTHGAIPYAERQRLGILDNLLRLSVGIEDPEMLRDDLEQAFQTAKIR